MKTTNKRILKEAAATLEVAIAKCLSQAKLHPSELEEIAALTTEELMSEHELDHLLAEKVRVHVQTEIQRHSQQGLMTYKPESRDSYGSMTRTHPIPESVSGKENVLTEIADFESKISWTWKTSQLNHTRTSMITQIVTKVMAAC